MESKIYTFVSLLSSFRSCTDGDTTRQGYKMTRLPETAKSNKRWNRARAPPAQTKLRTHRKRNEAPPPPETRRKVALKKVRRPTASEDEGHLLCLFSCLFFFLFFFHFFLFSFFCPLFSLLFFLNLLRKYTAVHQRRNLSETSLSSFATRPKTCSLH